MPDAALLLTGAAVALIAFALGFFAFPLAIRLEQRFLRSGFDD